MARPNQCWGLPAHLCLRHNSRTDGHRTPAEDRGGPVARNGADPGDRAAAFSDVPPPRTVRQVAAADRLLPRAGGAPLDRLAELAARLLGAAAAEVALLTDAHVVAGVSG